MLHGRGASETLEKIVPIDIDPVRQNGGTYFVLDETFQLFSLNGNIDSTKSIQR